tara:strand:- start:490 stop:957 length:468 start_codon:yes stop_codon:yes gene_type:complete
MNNTLLKICDLDNLSDIKQKQLIKNMAEGMNQDVFIDPNKNNLIKMKKTFIKKLAKKNKQEIYTCIGELILDITIDTEFWYLDYDDPKYKNNNYYECYHFSGDMLNKLQNESIIDDYDRLVEMKNEGNKIDKNNIVCFSKTRRFVLCNDNNLYTI